MERRLHREASDTHQGGGNGAYFQKPVFITGGAHSTWQSYCRSCYLVSLTWHFKTRVACCKTVVFGGGSRSELWCTVQHTALRARSGLAALRQQVRSESAPRLRPRMTSASPYETLVPNAACPTLHTRREGTDFRKAANQEDGLGPRRWCNPVPGWRRSKLTRHPGTGRRVGAKNRHGQHLQPARAQNTAGDIGVTKTGLSAISTCGWSSPDD